MESEVPQRRIGLNRFPWFYAGKRNVKDHDAARALRIETRDGIRDHAAVVVSGEINRGEEEFARELTNILRNGRGVIAACDRRLADTAHVHGEHREVRREPRHDSTKRGPILRKAVQEDQRRTSAAANIMESRCVHVRLTRDECVPKFCDSRIHRRTIGRPGRQARAPYVKNDGDARPQPETPRPASTTAAAGELATAYVHRGTGWPSPSKLPSLSLNQAPLSATPLLG
jgi:hypothetical protein